MRSMIFSRDTTITLCINFGLGALELSLMIRALYYLGILAILAITSEAI